jgi:hypothetical protein
VQMQEFQWLEERTHPGESFFDEPLLAMYLRLANPTRAEFVNRDEFTRPEDVREIVRILQTAPPRFIVLNPTVVSGGIHDHSGSFLAYVQGNYRLAQTFRSERTSAVEEVWEYRASCSSS